MYLILAVYVILVTEIARKIRERLHTRNKMSVHMALPCVMRGSWSSFLPSQQSSSIHLQGTVQSDLRPS